MSRTLAVTRMHLTDRFTLFGMPPTILAASFVVNMLIFAVEPVDARTSGGAAAIYIVVLVAAVLCTARGMAFALSMGSSRRSFALGTGATGALLAVVFGLVMLLFDEIEVATGGWWMHAHFFDQAWYAQHSIGVRWLIFTMPFFALYLSGAWISSIWLRWNMHGVVVGAVLAILVLGGAAVLVTWVDRWGSIGGWLERLSPLVAAGWLAVLCLPLAGASYAVLRRVTL
jgi:hypothetical protein